MPGRARRASRPRSSQRERPSHPAPDEDLHSGSRYQRILLPACLDGGDRTLAPVGRKNRHRIGRAHDPGRGMRRQDGVGQSLQGRISRSLPKRRIFSSSSSSRSRLPRARSTLPVPCPAGRGMAPGDALRSGRARSHFWRTMRGQSQHSPDGFSHSPWGRSEYASGEHRGRRKFGREFKRCD